MKHHVGGTGSLDFECMVCVSKNAKKKLSPEGLTCPLKRDHFKKEMVFHHFSASMFVFRGVCIYVYMFAYICI